MTELVNNRQWLDKPDGDGWWWHWEIHQPYIDDLDEQDVCIVLIVGDNIYYEGHAGHGDKVSLCGTYGTTIKWQRVLPHSPFSV